MGSKQRSKGAAPKRKRAIPPGRAGAGVAPKLSPLDELDEVVEALRTEQGRARAYANLYRQASRGTLTRDASSGLTLAKHCIDRFGSLEKDRELPEKMADLQAQLVELREAIAGTKGSALRADTAVVPPFVEDEQRTDMAATTPPPRGGEPYKS